MILRSTWRHDYTLLPKQAVAGSSPVPSSTERDGIMPNDGALHIGAPRLISPLGPVWVQTIEKLPLIRALGRLSAKQDCSQHVDGALLQAGQTMGVAVRA